jgi:hypothetical protein
MCTYIYDKFQLKNLGGIVVAMAGMILYGHIKTVDGKRAMGEPVDDCLGARVFSLVRCV